MDKKSKAGDPSLKECGNCGIRDGVRGINLGACGRCGVTHYCGKACQMQHYSDHKSLCVSPKDRTLGAVAAAAVEVADEASGNHDGEEETSKVAPMGQGGDHELECPICLEAIGSELFDRTTLPCKHTMHKKCVDGLRKLSVLQACPLCRNKLPERPNPEQLYEEATRRWFAIQRKIKTTGDGQEILTQSQQSEMTNIIEMWTDAAKEGHEQAQGMLLVHYDFGSGVPKSTKEAIRFARMTAETGDSQGQFYLGEFYREGRGVPQNNTIAFKWYEKSALQGYQLSIFSLGRMYQDGLGVQVDYQQAYFWLAKASKNVKGAEGSWREANLHLGDLYARGHGVAQSDSKAAQYTTKAAEGGLKEAMPLLAEYYFEGKGVPTSVSKAAKWVRLAIEKGGEPKLYLVHNIAFAYSVGQGVKKSLSSSLDLYEYAAQKGQLESQQNLGVVYRDGGPGFPKNPAKAAQWLEAAAEQADAEYQYFVAGMFENGYGVAQSYHKAVKWYSRAAVRNQRGAQFCMGVMHYHGHGGLKKNAAEAAKWYHKAAGRGHANAMGALGDMYSRGEGVIKSASKSKTFFKMCAAAQQDDSKSEAQESSLSDAESGCANCGEKPGQHMQPLKSCSRCKAVWYCNAGCQRGHWKAHRGSCVAIATSK